MKAFLVIAGLLMTGASVYGVVDYNKKVDDKAFKELYKENTVHAEVKSHKEEVSSLVLPEKEVSKKEAAVKTEPATEKKVLKKKTPKKKKEVRQFSTKAFSRSKLG